MEINLKKCKKILIVLFLSFLLSGCQINYEITINDDTINESTFLYSNDIDEIENASYRGATLRENFQAFSSFKQSAFTNDSEIQTPEEVDSHDNGTPLYRSRFIDNDSMVGTKFSYDFPIDKYELSSAAIMGARTFEVENSDDYLELEIGDSYLFTSYALLDKITFKVTVNGNYEEKLENADDVQDNVYKWEVTRDNYVGKKARLRLKKIKDGDSSNPSTTPSEETTSTVPDSDSSSIDSVTIILIVSLLAIVGLILVLVLSGKNKYNNRI